MIDVTSVDIVPSTQANVTTNSNFNSDDNSFNGEVTMISEIANDDENQHLTDFDSNKHPPQLESIATLDLFTEQKDTKLEQPVSVHHQLQSNDYLSLSKSKTIFPRKIGDVDLDDAYEYLLQEKDEWLNSMDLSLSSVSSIPGPTIYGNGSVKYSTGHRSSNHMKGMGYLGEEESESAIISDNNNDNNSNNINNTNDTNLVGRLSRLSSVNSRKYFVEEETSIPIENSNIIDFYMDDRTTDDDLPSELLLQGFKHVHLHRAKSGDQLGGAQTSQAQSDSWQNVNDDKWMVLLLTTLLMLQYPLFNF